MYYVGVKYNQGSEVIYEFELERKAKEFLQNCLGLQLNAKLLEEKPETNKGRPSNEISDTRFNTVD